MNYKTSRAIRRYREVMYYMTRKEHIEEKEEKEDVSPRAIKSINETHKGKKIDFYI